MEAARVEARRRNRERETSCSCTLSHGVENPRERIIRLYNHPWQLTNRDATAAKSLFATDFDISAGHSAGFNPPRCAAAARS